LRIEVSRLESTRGNHNLAPDQVELAIDTIWAEVSAAIAITVSTNPDYHNSGRPPSGEHESDQNDD
jgi:hypothetical protein